MNVQSGCFTCSLGIVGDAKRADTGDVFDGGEFGGAENQGGVIEIALSAEDAGTFKPQLRGRNMTLTLGAAACCTISPPYCR